ncbi:MAG: autotransporter-associated beta strand repeat-containing protein [Verrucomicrobia bacterium]|nr:autotransporter-associated beta strand repeat-containing protein [Verrucomicrobiota bacterium]
MKTRRHFSFLRGSATVVLALCAVPAHAEDLTFSGTGTVRMLATDWADYLGGNATFNGGVNAGGRLYWRGSAGDGQYLHFDLTRLSGLTVSSSAAVTLQNAEAYWGGSVSNSFIATANGAWSAASGTGIPGATAIGDSSSPAGPFNTGDSATWSIGASTFQGYVDNASAFNGLAIIGGADSTLHFNAPLNPYLEVQTNAAMSGVVTVAGGGAWNASNYAFTNGVLTINNVLADGSSGGGAVTINSLGTVFVNGNSGDNRYWAIDSTTVNAGGVLVIQGHSHLHNLTLAGGELGGIRPNGTWGGWTFDDATTVTATSTISAQQMNLDANGTFTVNSGATLNMTGSIRSGSLTKNGSGTMVLAGANGSSGGITINGGTLIATKSVQDDGIHTLGSGTLTVNAGGTLLTTRNWATSSEWNPTSVGSITINQGGSWSIEGVGQTVYNGLYLNGGAITGTASHGDWGALHLKSDITAGGNAVSAIGVDTAFNWTRTITVDGGSQLDYSGTIHNQITTTGAINKAGAGTLVLSGANSYTGQTDITAGTLVAANSTALGPGGHNGGTMSWIRDGATLALQGGVSLDEHFHVWGSGVGGLGAVRSLSGDNALTNSPSGGAGYCLRSDTTVGVDAGTLTVSGFYQDSGSFGLIKVGSGTLRLTAESTYSGGTTVNQGTLRLESNGGTGRIRGALTVNTGGTVETFGDGTGLGYVDQISSVIINGGTVTSAGSMHVWNITGGINMTGGTLQSNNGTSDPGGAQLEWNRTAVNTNASADTATIGGRIRIRGDHGNTGINFTVADGAAPTDLLVSAAVTEASGGMGITKNGPGKMVLTGTNGYTGPTTVNAGTLSLGNGTTGTNLDNNATVYLESTAALDLNFTGTDEVGSLVIDGIDQGSGTFDATTHPGLLTGTGSLLVFANDGRWIASANGNWGSQPNWDAGSVASGIDKTATFDGATGTTVTLESNRMIGNLAFSVENYTINGSATLILASTSGSALVSVADGKTATISAGIAGTAALEKLDPGTLTLAGPINYKGGTVVSAGTLELPGGDWVTGQPWNSSGATGPVIVESGATLSTSDGVTQIQNGLTLNGGTVVSRGLTYNDAWGNLFLSSNIAAGGAAASAISSQIVLTANRTVTVDAGSSLAITGKVTSWNHPGAGLVKAGEGSLTLSASNSYTGNTWVTAGTLILGNGTNHSGLADGADVIVESGAALELNFSGTDTIDELWLGGVAMSPGTYNSGNSGGFITGTGSLIVSNGPASDPFLAWIDATWPSLSDKTPGGDPDNDGIPNLLEYVFSGGDPSVSDSGILPTADAGGTNFVFTFHRRSDSTADTTQVFQYGSDLSGWTPVPVVNGGQVVILPNTPTSGIDKVVITIPKGANTSLFGRLGVTKP